MRFYLLFVIVLIGCCWSCSNDDLDTMDTEASQDDFPTFSLLSRTPDGVQQFTFDAITQTGSLINLSQEAGISTTISRFYVADKVVGMYVSNLAWLVNLETGNVVMGENAFSQSDEVFFNWTVNSATTVYTGFHQGAGFMDFNVLAQNVVDETQQFFEVGAIAQTTPPVFSQGYLAFHHNQSSGSSAIGTFGLINTITNTSVGLTTLFGDFISGTVFGENNDIYVFSTAGQYFRYRLDDLSLMETVPSSFSVPLNGREQLQGNTLYYSLVQPQPAITVATPAVYDLSTGMHSEVDIITTFQNLQSTRGYTELQPTDIQYSFTENAWLVGYRFTTSDDSGGGVFKIDDTGTILGELVLDMAPEVLIVLE